MVFRHARFIGRNKLYDERVHLVSRMLASLEVLAIDQYNLFTTHVISNKLIETTKIDTLFTNRLLPGFNYITLSVFCIFFGVLSNTQLNWFTRNYVIRLSQPNKVVLSRPPPMQHPQYLQFDIFFPWLSLFAYTIWFQFLCSLREIICAHSLCGFWPFGIFKSISHFYNKLIVNFYAEPLYSN